MSLHYLPSLVIANDIQRNFLFCSEALKQLKCLKESQSSLKVAWQVQLAMSASCACAYELNSVKQPTANPTFSASSLSGSFKSNGAHSQKAGDGPADSRYVGQLSGSAVSSLLAIDKWNVKTFVYNSCINTNVRIMDRWTASLVRIAHRVLTRQRRSLRRCT